MLQKAWRRGLSLFALLPTPIIKRLNEEINAVLASPEVKEVLAVEASVPQPGTPAEFGQLIRFEIDRWSKLIKDNRIPTE